MLLNLFMRVPPFRIEFLVAKKPLPDRVHPFQFLKSILDRCDYDLCLDFALNHSRRGYDYCLEFGKGSTISPLLKLHGSINWGLSADDKIVPFHIQEARFDFLFDSQHVFYNLGSNLNGATANGKQRKGPPIIVPPTWNKNSYHEQLSNVWSKAAYELAAAENIFVIGYSLPETDSFFRYLYALGTESSVRLRNFVVINKDNSGLVESRFRKLIGKGIENRFKYVPESFEKSMPTILNILSNP